VKQSKPLADQEGWRKKIVRITHEGFVNLLYCNRANILDCFVPRNDESCGEILFAGVFPLFPLFPLFFDSAGWLFEWKNWLFC
jgi:hypothetical protein